jgi:CRISPR-associated protein (TIGR03986 family)
METGKITKQGKGWLISFDAGKTMTISWRNIPDTWDGATLAIERDKSGQVCKLINAGVTLEKVAAPVFKQTQQRDNPYNRQYQNNNDAEDYAVSPYNFVPLQQQVLEGEPAVSFNKYYEDRNTGYIDIRIENKTPLFIRGKNENFFKVNGKDTIPGSSIRGLVSTMVEILSYSKFLNFDNTKYFMRFIAASASNYKSHYYKKMGLSEDRNTPVTHKAKAGFLKYNAVEFAYYIYPGTKGIEDTAHEGVEFKHKYDDVRKGWKVFSGNMKNGDRDKKQWFIPDGNLPKPVKIDDAVVQDYINDKNRNTRKLDILKLARKEVGSGKIYKVGVPVFYSEENNKIASFGHTKNYRVPYDNYTDNLVQPGILKACNHIDIAERIFGKVASVGKTADSSADVSGKVFFEDAHRLEDADDYILEIPKILSGPKPTSFQLYLEQNGRPKTYNIGNKANLVYWDTAGAQIRGHKFYWHRVTTSDNGHAWYDNQFSVSGDNFDKFFKLKKFPAGTFGIYKDELHIKLKNDGSLEKVIFLKPYSEFPAALKSLLNDLFYPVNEKADYKPQSAPIKAIPGGNAFNGRIRFENLTNIELGALLTAIDLPADCCHKIGMGKPLGLGTIKISANLVLSDRAKRYNLLFDNYGAWDQPLVKDKGIDHFKKVFTDFLLAAIDPAKKSIWEIGRLAQLKTILEFDPVRMASAAWLEKTRYMTIKPKEFQKRDVLPNPKEVKELT